MLLFLKESHCEDGRRDIVGGGRGSRIDRCDGDGHEIMEVIELSEVIEEVKLVKMMKVVEIMWLSEVMELGGGGADGGEGRGIFNAKRNYVLKFELVSGISNKTEIGSQRRRIRRLSSDI